MIVINLDANLYHHCHHLTIRFLKKFKKVKVCLDGKLKYKPIKDVEFTLACNGIRH